MKTALVGGGVLALVIVLGYFFSQALLVILFFLWLDTFVLKRYYHLGIAGIETTTIGIIFLGLMFGPLIGLLGGLFLPLLFGLGLLLVEAHRQKDAFSAPTIVDPVNGVVGLLAGLFAGVPLLAIGVAVVAKIILFSVFIHFTDPDVGGIFFKTITNIVNAGFIALLFFTLGPLIFFTF